MYVCMYVCLYVCMYVININDITHIYYHCIIYAYIYIYVYDDRRIGLLLPTTIPFFQSSKRYDYRICGSQAQHLFCWLRVGPGVQG